MHNHLTLTPRERQVAKLVAQGYTNPESAERINVKRETVKSHVWHVLRKLKIDNREEVRDRLNGEQAKHTKQPSSYKSVAYTDLLQSTQLFLSRVDTDKQQSMLRNVAALHDKLHALGDGLDPDDVVELLSSIGLLMLSRESLEQARIINLARLHGLIYRNGDER